MPAIRIPREKYDRLVQAFREKPNVARAAREAGCSEKAAYKAFHRGYDRPEWASVPIKQLLEEEQLAARAKLEEERRMREGVSDEFHRSQAGRASRYADEREKAKDDAAQQQAAEGRAVRAAMVHGQAILAIAGQLGQAALPIVQRAAELIAHERPGTYKEVIDLVAKVAWLGQSAVAVVGRAMELERLRLGKPDKILGVQSAATNAVDGDLAVELIGSEEEVVAAIKELAEGKMTDRALKLLEAVPSANTEVGQA